MSAFKIMPGEKHADYLPRLREHNAAERERTGPALRAIDEQRRKDRERLASAIETIPDADERAFVRQAVL